MNVKMHTYSIILYLFSSVRGSRFCQWSKESAVAVSFCPNNKTMMEVRAKIKNCEAMAWIQNCTSPEKFKYHCVMDELETKFVEVCAPEYYIHGYCTEYNALGAVIQEHFSLKCSDVKPPCNTSYLSTDAYLYRGCYKKVMDHTQIPSTASTLHLGLQTTLSNHLLTDKSKNSYLPTIAEVAAIPAVIIFSTCLYVIYKRHRAVSSGNSYCNISQPANLESNRETSS